MALLLVALAVGAAGCDTPEDARRSRRDALLAEQLAIWKDPAALTAARARLRATNPEYDFMWRTFFVLALANLALEEPSPADAPLPILDRGPSRADAVLPIIDRILDDTERLEAEHGQAYFLLPYAHAKPFLAPAGRSIFVDGEIALMLGARLVVRDDPALRDRLAARVEILTREMRASPLRSAESYPDEVWIFCNTTALAALRLHEVLDHADHGALIADWIAQAEMRKIDPKTGLLISSMTWHGVPLDGPEGSTLWLSMTNLLLVDEAFAREQYRRAKAALAGSFLGFGYAREWPDAWPGTEDVDSGPIVPGLAASPGSSGFAILAANAFGDDDFLEALVDALGIADAVLTLVGLDAMIDNPLGDAVILYGLSFGPLWRAARERATLAPPP